MVVEDKSSEPAQKRGSRERIRSVMDKTRLIKEGGERLKGKRQSDEKRTSWQKAGEPRPSKPQGYVTETEYKGVLI